MSKKHIFIDYLLVLILIINSGFPLFYKDPIIVRNAYLTTLSITLYFWYVHSNKKIPAPFGIYALWFFVIFVMQAITLEFFPIAKVGSFLIKLFFTYIILKITNIRFYKVYVNIILAFTFISFVFYFSVLLFPQLESFLKMIAFTHPTATFQGGDLHNLIIYHINFGAFDDKFLRNSGPFWEPGAFSGFLIIAIIFNLISKQSLFSKKNTFLIIGVITTFSTTGYICLSVLAIYYIIVSKKQFLLLLLPLIIGGVYYSFMNLEFLNEKINTQIDQTKYDELEGNTRFGSFIIDLEDFSKNPIFGLGLSAETRYLDFESNGMSNRNNGDSDFLVRFGLTGFLMYFVSMFLGFYKQIKYHKSPSIGLYFFIIIIFLLGFSELYFQFPFFIALSIYPWVVDLSSSKKIKS